MHELKEMAEIVAKNRLKSFDILNITNLSGKKSSPFVKVYHGLLNGHLNTDAEMGKFIKKKVGGEAFRSFKHRLKIKLENSLFFVNFNREGVSAYMKAEIECARMQFIIRVLSLLNGRKTAEKYCQKLLHKAEKHELAEYAAYANRILSIYSSYTGSSKFESYVSGYEIWAKITEMEEKAQISLSRINIQFANTIASKPEMAKTAFEYAKRVKEYIKFMEDNMSMPGTFKLYFHYYKLAALGHEIAGQYLHSIQEWQKLEKYMSDRPLFASGIQSGKIAQQLMGNYMHLQQLELAEIQADRCEKYFIKGSNNWHTFMIFNFLLAMQMAKYDKAAGIFDKATNDSRLLLMPIPNQEKWKIFEAYLYYVENRNNKHKDNLKDNLQRKIVDRQFRFSSFVNDLHVYNKDKSGFYIAILVIEICILIQSKDESKIISRMQELKLYRTRYLGKTTNTDYRVKVFMELLFTLEKANYQPKALSNKADKFLEKLKAKPMDYSDNIEGIEVIEFEKLWGAILEDCYK